MKIEKITAAITTAAGKVFKMKTSQKIAIGAAAAVAAAATGVVIAKNIQAKKQERSVQSLVLEEAARALPAAVNNEKSYEEYLQKSAEPFVLPQAVRKRIGMTELDGFEDTFVIEPKEKTSDIVIFYIHGTNYWFNPSRYHYAFMRRLSNNLGMQMIVPIYPKAPSHTAVEMQQMVIDRYLYLGMALAILQKLRYLALPMPKQAFLISPWLDVTNSNPKMEDIQPNDTILNIEKLAFKGQKYAGELELTHPMVSPIYGDLAGLPKITVFVGTREIFCADVEKLEEIALEKDLDIEVYVYKNQMHFFVGLPIPEAEDAMNIIASELYGAEDSDELFEVEEDIPEVAEVIVVEDAENTEEEAPEVTEESFEEISPDEDIPF